MPMSDGAPSGSIAWLFRPRSLALLLVVSGLIGAVYALTMFPLTMVAGTSDFWLYPRQGADGGANTDMMDILVGANYVAEGPWRFPLLYIDKLGVPAGTSAFWLDCIPWLTLLGKVVFDWSGHFINLLGFYYFACYMLAAVAMTVLLFVAGQRSLMAALAGGCLSAATPFLLFRWNHAPLIAQFWLPLALALYLLTLRTRMDRRCAAAWLVLFAMLAVSNMYLLGMVGSIWAATLAQRWLDGAPKLPLLVEAGLAGAVVLALLVAEGAFSGDLAQASAWGFGKYSMNLLGPLVPQRSGLFPPLRDFVIGADSQYEGFAYLGFGALLLTVLAIPGWLAWLRHRAKPNAALIAVLIGFVLFALTHRVYAHSYLLLELPLPEFMVHALGALFRSSGRFFWPVGYAIVAGSIVLLLRRWRPMASAVALCAAVLLQFADTEPLRSAVAESVQAPAIATYDRERVASMVGLAEAVMVFPTHFCTLPEARSRGLPGVLMHRNLQTNMELQLMAARADLPINSVYNSRLKSDCAAEDVAMHAPLTPGELYVYLRPFRPAPQQLGGHTPEEVCATVDWLLTCQVPRG